MSGPRDVCRCGGMLYSSVERDSGVCDQCDAEVRRKRSGPPPETVGASRPRYRCTECDAVCLSEEEEANQMCEACLREAGS